MNESMTALLNIDLKTFILTLCALMTAWMGLSKILDFMIEKIGIETKASLRRKKVDASLKEIAEMQSSMKQLKEMMEIHIEKDKARTVVSQQSPQRHGIPKGGIP